MNSEVLCDIIIEKNIQLSKEQIKRIEDFAIRAEDPEVALALCCYTFDADVSKMLDVILNYDCRERSYALGFLVDYNGVLSNEDVSKLDEYFTHRNIPYTTGIGKESGEKIFKGYDAQGRKISLLEKEIKEEINERYRKANKKQQSKKEEHGFLEESV